MSRNPPIDSDECLEELANVAERYDSQVRLLFQLVNYVSLVKYDPVVARRDRSAEFRRFVAKHNLDLWEQLNKKTDTRKSTKRLANVHQEVIAVQKRLEAERKAVNKQTQSAHSTDARKPVTTAPSRSKRPSSSSSSSRASKRVKEEPKPRVKERSRPERRDRSERSVQRKIKQELLEENLPTDNSTPFDIDSDLGWPDEKVEAVDVLLTNPASYVKSVYGGLESLLASYRTLQDDNEPITSEQWEKRVISDAVVYKRVDDARKSGLLASLEANGIGSSSPIPKFNDPTPKEPSYFDYLLSHSIQLGKQRSNLRKFHQAIVRRNTQSIDQYFRRLAGAEDREKKEMERLIRQIAKRTGQEVMKKWKLAAKIVEQRRQAILDEEKREKGKEYLNQILDKSAKLIKSRNDMDLQSENDSSSDSHSDVDMEDANLTLEQLKEKYRDLPEVESEDDSSSESDMTSNSEAEKPSEEALKLYAEIEGDSESELESESESEESNSESDVSDGGKPLGLAALLGGNVESGSSDSDAVSGSESESESESESGSASESDPGSQSQLELELDDVAGQAEGVTAELIEARNEERMEASDVMEVDNEEPKEVIEKVRTHDGKEEDEEGGREGEDKDGESEDLKASDTQDKLVKSDVDHESESDAKREKKEPGASENLETGEVILSEQSKELETHRISPPSLLRGTLREYQRNGLDWMAGLVMSGTNGILADEMGLGKTIQTIALMAWLASEKHIWGPHLVIVPTSVMLNWEMEFKRFLPGFKILTYFGTPQQRKRKRRGWNKEDTWHVVITSYQLVIQDQAVFRGKRWQFMVLDEAHNIKNFRSQRWQALLNFNAQFRLLLTGTPLQNNLVELWSLLYFLMPSTRATQMMPAGFASLDDFQEWFAKPVDKMVQENEEADDDARATISKLHQVLRPYLLRRLKIDVEKQMPAKYEHVLYCRLSKRQRYLYDDFMSRASTKATLESGNFMSILNCLMQLRKVCNHPDLFEVRPILTSFSVDKSVSSEYQFVAKKFSVPSILNDVHPVFLINDIEEPTWVSTRRKELCASDVIKNHILTLKSELQPVEPNFEDVQSWAKYNVYMRRCRRLANIEQMLKLNDQRIEKSPMYGSNCFETLNIFKQPRKGVLSLVERSKIMQPIIERFGCITPAVVLLDQPELCLGSAIAENIYNNPEFGFVKSQVFHESQVRLSIAFPDKRLIQYDCGKLQTLALLLRDLISGGHRCLIFTQMTRVLDILEQFLNLHGWRYLRLDGATRIEQRQALTERFNKDASIPVFILSTRSGGLGINLTGADTVIFYDSDWNPAMDRQCQDRCHRIGQTRDVHIYRLVSEYTIESNILRKATQKTLLDNVVIQEGDFTTDHFTKMSVQDILGNDAGRTTKGPTLEELQGGNNVNKNNQIEAAMAQTEDKDDQLAANQALNEARLDQDEFEEKQPETNQKSAQSALDVNSEPRTSSEPPNNLSSHDANLISTTAGTVEQNVDSVSPVDHADNVRLATSVEPDETLEVIEVNEVNDTNDNINSSNNDQTEMGHIDDWMILAIERGLFD